MTPRCSLARSIAFRRQLTHEQIAEVTAAGLATPEDFATIEDDGLGFPVVAGFRYAGSKWDVDFCNGRLLLVEAGMAATGYVAEMERRFAVVLHLVGGPDRGPRSDDEVDALRSSPEWAEPFAAAAALDMRMAEFRRRGGPELELAIERLARCGDLIARHDVDLSAMWADPVRLGDESAMARYAIVMGSDRASGEASHAIEFHDDVAVAVERVLCMTIVTGWLLGLFDLDRTDYTQPLILDALVTIDGDPQFGVRRIVPFAATER